MTEQEIIDDIFDKSNYFYPETYKFLKSLPNTIQKDQKSIVYFKSDVVKYALDKNLTLPEGYLNENYTCIRSSP